MPVHFVCPHCGKETDVADRFAGMTGPCAQCGKAISVPPLKGDLPFPPPKSNKSLLISAVIVLSFIGLLIALLIPAVGGHRVPHLRSQCTFNLKQIALALHNYCQQNKCYPPAFIPDKNGRPMHSWRVLILPYLEEEALYKQYRFNEPWDSPHNRKVTAVMPRIFRCPSQPDDTKSTTSYMMIVGPHTISDGPHSRRFEDIKDGSSNTIMLVEVADVGTSWAEPKDLEFDRIDFKIGGEKSQGIGSHHNHGANFALCDGSVRFLSSSKDPKTIKAMATIDGGEKVEPLD